MALALLPLALGLTALSTGIGVVGAISNGMAQSKAAKFNQQVANNNASAAQAQSAYEVSQKDLHLRQILAEQTAAGAAGGTVGGSLTDVKYSSEVQGKLDQLATKYQGDVQANAYRSQGQLQGMAADNAMTNAMFSAGGSLIGGASSAVGTYSSATGYGYKPTTKASYQNMPSLDGYIV